MSSPNPSRQKSVLWHLMEEGSLEVKDIQRLTGWKEASVRTNIAACISRTLVQRVDLPRTSPAVYGLTALGIDAALQVERSAVHFAPAQPDVTPAKAATAAEVTSLAPEADEQPAECSALTLPIDENFVGMVDSNGVLVLTVNQVDAVLFTARAALKLQRFLAGIGFLAQLDAEGAL